MSCQRSPASLPNTQRSHRLEALIRVPVQVQGNFLAIWWFAESAVGWMGFRDRILAIRWFAVSAAGIKYRWSDLLWGMILVIRWFAESAAGIKHRWSDLKWEVEIKEISRPDMSKAGKAFHDIYIYLNRIYRSQRVGGWEKTIDCLIQQIWDRTHNLQISAFAFWILWLVKLTCITETRNCFRYRLHNRDEELHSWDEELKSYRLHNQDEELFQ